MKKHITPLIIVLVILYLAGLAYLAFQDANREPAEVEEKEMMIAPDGSVLKGPTGPPRLAPVADPTRSPERQSVGPTEPPPPSGNR